MGAVLESQNEERSQFPRVYGRTGYVNPRKYSENPNSKTEKLDEEVEWKRKTVHANSIFNENNEFLQGKSLQQSMTDKIADAKMESSDDSSENEDTQKFLAAAKANGLQNSEMTAVNKLLSSAKKQRKNTIDVENYVVKSTVEDKSKNHMIKKGYYAKLGIGRGSGYQPGKQIITNKKTSIGELKQESEEATSKIKKSFSSNFPSEEGLEVENHEEGKSQSYIAQSQFTEMKEDHFNMNQEPTNDTYDGFKATKVTKRDLQTKKTDEYTRKRSWMAHVNQVEVESYETKESGNWRLDLHNTPTMARSGNRIRQDLLGKLTIQKIWPTPAEKKGSHQTVFIYDWDDTLLWTSFLNPSGYYEENIEIPEMAKKHLKKLEKGVEKLITSSVKLGKTFIVTNAWEGWVQFSSQKYMPKVHEALKNVEVISARSRYEVEFPGDSYEWKMQAFTDIQKELESSMITNIIAWGDSRIEMDAARHIAKLFHTAFIKTIKFKETPTPEELIKQLNLVIQKLDHISSNPRNLTIRLERKGK